MVNGGDRRTKGWMDEKMDGRTHRRTDVSKFPMFYRTSALWGRCSKRAKRGRTRIEREEEEEDQVIQGSHMVSITQCPAWSDG